MLIPILHLLSTFKHCLNKQAKKSHEIESPTMSYNEVFILTLGSSVSLVPYLLPTASFI